MDWKYVKRGAILGIIFVVITLFFGLYLTNRFNLEENILIKVISFPIGIFLLLLFNLGDCSGERVLGCALIFAISYPLFGIITGSLIGYIYEKIKNKNQTNKK